MWNFLNDFVFFSNLVFLFFILCIVLMLNLVYEYIIVLDNYVCIIVLGNYVCDIGIFFYLFKLEFLIKLYILSVRLLFIDNIYLLKLWVKRKY